MNMETIGWIIFGWFAFALVVSIALGSFLGQVNSPLDEDDLASAASKRKVMRFMRTTPKALSLCKIPSNSEVQATGKRRVRLTG